MLLEEEDCAGSVRHDAVMGRGENVVLVLRGEVASCGEIAMGGARCIDFGFFAVVTGGSITAGRGGTGMGQVTL